MGRGVVQLSGYVDLVLASLLAIGALARLRYAQTLYVLPVSLFGMSVAAAELPDLARERDRATGALRERAAARFVASRSTSCRASWPSSCSATYWSPACSVAGEFGAADVTVVWVTLVGYSAGLLASTCTRVYQSAFFALRDTATPARVAGAARAGGVRGRLAADGAVRARHPVRPHAPGRCVRGRQCRRRAARAAGARRWRAVGAWVEWWLLKRRLVARIGAVGTGAGQLARMAAAALVAAAVARAVTAFVPWGPLPTALLVAGVFGAVYSRGPPEWRDSPERAPCPRRCCAACARRLRRLHAQSAASGSAR